MTPQSALKKLKGTTEQKNELFNSLIDKSMSSTLEDWERVMLEAVKKELFPKKEVVQMSATMKGVGGARV